jgi:protocatechuate 3,4-dioxygenase beta subunit
VVDVQGRPVAAVRVSASWPEPGETLSELPCPPEALSLDALSHAPWRMPDCIDEAEALVLELAGARQGEAPVHAEATTAADGTFTLEGLPDGPLTLWALGETGAAMRSGIPAGTDGVELVLEEGHTLTGAVHGEGAPLAGVRVTAVSVQHTRFFDTATGVDGDYRAGPLPPGSYVLLLIKEGWLPAMLPSGLTRLGHAGKVTLHRPRTLTGRVLSSGAPAPGVQVRVGAGSALPGPSSRTVTADAQGRFTLLLPPGAHTLSAASEGRSALARVELGAGPPPEVVLELGSALQLSGHVLDERRRPVAGARLELRHPADASQQWAAVTDAEGRYAFGPLEPGDWELGIQARRYLDVPVETYTLPPDMGPLDFTLVRLPSVEGRVTDTTGRPLPRIELRLMTLDAEDAVVSQDWTDDEGRFVLDAEGPGAFHIEVEDERYLRDSFPVRVPARNVHLTLRSGASLLGTLVDARGLPLEGFQVKALSMAPEEDPRAPAAVTDARGRFCFQGLKPGAYRLGAARPSEGVERKAWREVELREEAPLEVELRLPEEHTLSGEVVDTQGRPLPGARVGAWMTPEDEPESLRGLGGGAPLPGGVPTDSAGRFTLRHLTVSRYDVWAQAEGHTFLPERSAGGAARKRSLRVLTKDAAGVRLVLKREPRLVGRAVGPDGAPLPIFGVNGQTQVSPEGRFSAMFRSESAAESFVFSTEGLGALVRDVQPLPGGDVDVGEVRLERGRVLVGRVVDERTERPLPNALLTLTAEAAADAPGGKVRTDAEGIFQMTGLAAVPYTVEVIEAPGYRPLRVRVGTHRQQPVTLHLEPAAP